MPTIRLLLLITGNADLQRLHVPYRFSEIVVIPTAMNAWGHHLARRRATGIEVVLRQPFADDVAVGHHADQAVVLSNRDGAYIMLTHQFREFSDRGVRTDPIDALVHRFFDFHRRPPSLMPRSPPFRLYNESRPITRGVQSVSAHVTNQQTGGCHRARIPSPQLNRGDGKAYKCPFVR